MKAVTDEQRHETFFPLIRRHLPRLYRFVRHALAYVEAVGDLPPGELTPEDVADTVVLRAYREFAKDPSGRNIGDRLIKIAQEYIVSEVKRRRAERRRTVPKEKDIPETPPSESVTMLGEEIMYFYQPDEDLKLEDVVSDLDVSTPEEEAERKEIWRCVNRSLAKMPQDWRRALMLSRVDGLADTELAQAIGRPEPEARRLVEQARDYLRRQLLEAGCVLKEGDQVP